MTENPTIEATGLTVRYGARTVLDDVSLRIEPGTVYALLGRNGSGKSTLVRTLLGMQRAESGRTLVFAEDSWKRRIAVLSRTGFIAEDDDVERTMSVKQLTGFHRSLNRQWDASRIEAKLGTLGIGQTTRFGELSKGQRRQVLLALALASDPELLVLDDPTLGLDVVAKKDLYDDLLAELADRGTTTLITTHDLNGIEGIADRVGILANARLLLDESLETLKNRFRRIRRSEAGSPPADLQVVRSHRWGEWIEEVVDNYAQRPEGDSFEAAPMSLEEIFIAVTGEKES
ncbi:MAG TPA: ABC transporter ATP-binding protein [Thermoanaerobaculia bacterium]|nr:ABC transporter ATP-binding protein [Thermoanaerobaculia bacterium]